MSGECVHGPLKGVVLEVEVLELKTAARAANHNPQTRLAPSRMGWLLRLVTRIQQKRGTMDSAGAFPPGFRKTMGEADRRLPEMEIGLGVWAGGASRFYPRQRIVERGKAVVDRFNGRSLVIYNDPKSNAPRAAYVEAGSVIWQDDELDLGNGTSLSEGKLFVEGTAPRGSCFVLSKC